MRSVATTIGWELWARNRSGISTVLIGVLCFALTRFLLDINLDPNHVSGVALFIWSIILFAVTFLFLISVALYGDLRQGTFFCGFPARMFLLPVPTSRLVLWPMLYGLAALLLLWFAMALLVWLPAGALVQWWVLPLLAVVLVWFQAISWAVPGSAGAKVIAAGVILPALKFTLELVATTVAWFGYDHPRFDRDEFIAGRVVTLAIFCGCALPLGYAVAVWGVGRARRGNSTGFGWLGNLLDTMSVFWKRRTRFASPAGAQLWFEWRRTGLILPIFVIGFLVFVSAFVAPFVSAAGHLTLVVVLVCLVPFVAVLAGYLMGKAGLWGGDLALMSLLATRPRSNSSLATAKILAAALSALVAWVLLALLVPIWLFCFGTLDEVTELLRPFFRDWAVYQIIAVAGLGLIGLWALTWGQLVGVLTLTVTGRNWVVNLGVVFYLIVASFLIVLGRWAYVRPTEFESLAGPATWCAAGLLAMKLLAACWALADARRAGLLEKNDLAGTFSLWLLGATCLVALAYWLVPAEGLPVGTVTGTVNRLSASRIALVALLALPLARLAAAPRAFAWNRVR